MQQSLYSDSLLSVYPFRYDTPVHASCRALMNCFQDAFKHTVLFLCFLEEGDNNMWELISTNYRCVFSSSFS